MINNHRSSGRPKALLIDMDDTIITDDSVSEQAWRVVCAKFAPLLGISYSDLRIVIKDAANSYWRDPENHRAGRLNPIETRRMIICSALRTNNIDEDRLADRIADAYTAEKELVIAPIPGAIETLHSLKRAGLRLALITNGSGSVQRGKIVRFGLTSLFDFILIEGEFGEGKPHASVFDTALKKLKVYTFETWMVGDDLERDIAGAQKLGICGVWVDWRGNGIPLSSKAQPDCIVRSISQIFDIV